MLKEIYKKPKAYHEVNAAIYSEYYEDESVLLKDLLTPQTSPLYQTPKFKSLKAFPGEFKKEFFIQLNKGEYPHLKAAMNYQSNDARVQDYVDTTMEIFSNSSGVSIYFPYSENFATSLTTTYFDNVNTDAFGDFATVIPADREADSAPGDKPYRHKSYDEYGEIVWEIWYESVTVNDGFAEINPVHIVGVGVEPTFVNTGNQTNQIYVVFVGDVKCTHQYDRFISLTGNGGGSELRFIRGDNYLQLNNNLQVTNPGDVYPVYIKRKDIRQGNWKVVNGLWDPDWEVANLEQVFGIYEEDNQNTQTFTGSLQTTLTIPPVPPATTSPGTVVATRGYSLAVTSDDDIIRQINWDRASFYQYNQGGLNNGCGTRDGWTVYDCGTNVRYTMKTQ
jgi:hypothetical protein